MASKTKKRSEFFRVAVEGATTDGRVIERQQIADIAETYDPEVYGARIWLEHFRSTLPDSPFRAYGDVLAVKAEEVE
ncbi:TPA: GPO family capsid scaffolding protein, partial [Stenotrophomonas maltophilia]